MNAEVAVALAIIGGVVLAPLILSLDIFIGAAKAGATVGLLTFLLIGGVGTLSGQMEYWLVGALMGTIGGVGMYVRARQKRKG